MYHNRWQRWLAAEPVKINLLNQLVAHCVCRMPIARQQLVPGSEAAEAPTSWQDLENDGLAYLGDPCGFSAPVCSVLSCNAESAKQ